jgi:hypothetical protein
MVKYRRIAGTVMDKNDDGCEVHIESWEDADGHDIMDDFNGTIEIDSIAATDKANFKELEAGDDFEMQVSADWLSNYI